MSLMSSYINEFWILQKNKFKKDKKEKETPVGHLKAYFLFRINRPAQINKSVAEQAITCKFLQKTSLYFV